MLVLCIALGWHVERVRKQREAVAWVREKGGTVWYEYDADLIDLFATTSPRPRAPEWLREQLGVDFFEKVVGVELRGDNINDVTPLARMTAMQRLYLHGTSVSDLSPLAGMTQLQYLYVSDTSVSDLSPLSGLLNVTIYLDESQQVNIPKEQEGRVTRY